MDAFEEREKDAAYERIMFRFGIIAGTIGCAVLIGLVSLLNIIYT